MTDNRCPPYSLPDDWWRRASTYDVLDGHFRRHLLALYVAVRQGSEVKEEVLTGFLVDFGGALLWMTAGHVIDYYGELLTECGSNIVRMFWLDDSGVPGAENVVVHNRHPLRYRSSFGDFGVLHIAGLDAANIRANPQILPLTPQVWRNAQDAAPEGYFISGFPGEWVAFERNPEGDGRTMYTFSADISYLPVSRVPFRGCADRFFDDPDPDAFYGRIEPFVEDPSSQPGSIVGMSGGPVFSLERDPDGRIRYRLLAIQSSWYGPERLIKAEPIMRALGLSSQ